MRLFFKALKTCFVLTKIKRQVDFFTRYLYDCSLWELLQKNEPAQWVEISEEIIRTAFGIGLIDRYQFCLMYREWKTSVFAVNDKSIGKMFKALSKLGIGWRK